MYKRDEKKKIHNQRPIRAQVSLKNYKHKYQRERKKINEQARRNRCNPTRLATAGSPSPTNQTEDSRTEF
jgi:hypothetical protein